LQAVAQAAREVAGEPPVEEAEAAVGGDEHVAGIEQHLLG